MDKQLARSVLFDISVAKKRIKTLRAEGRGEGDMRILMQLTRLQEMVNYFNPDEQYYLLFTEATPDGVIVTRPEYEKVLLEMTRLDMESHVLVELDLSEVA